MVEEWREVEEQAEAGSFVGQLEVDWQALVVRLLVRIYLEVG